MGERGGVAAGEEIASRGDDVATTRDTGGMFLGTKGTNHFPERSFGASWRRNSRWRLEAASAREREAVLDGVLLRNLHRVRSERKSGKDPQRKPLPRNYF